jgi:CheY-like chemotaxis protein
MHNERRHEPVLLLAIAATMVAAFLADLGTKIGITVWIFYLVPLVLTMRSTRPALPLVVAGLATALIVTGFLGSPRNPEFADRLAIINRSFGAVTFWIVAFVLRNLIASRNDLEARDWVKGGIARVATAVQGEKSTARLGEDVLAALCEVLDAPGAALYTAEGDRLRRIATRGVMAGPADRTEWTRGEGLPGAALADRRMLVHETLPEGYFRFASALGESAPRHLVVCPAVVDDTVTGVIELGLVLPVRPIDRELIGECARTIGVAIRSHLFRMRLRELLDETQRQAEELQTQQEELRVMNEELEENNRVLRESEARLQSQQAELEATTAQIEAQANALERQRDDLARTQGELVARADELSEANRYKSEFLANMSHELRTPLNSTLILSQLLADNRDGNLTAEQVGFATTIRAASNDLLALINDILELARVEAGKLDLDVQPVPVRSVLDALERLFRPVSEEKQLAFALSVEGAVPERLVTDSRRLQQILRNLLSNAMKFTAQGEVTLTVRPAPGDRVAFAVRDTGIGIAPEQRDLIFEAFRQANGRIERRYGGTGLGLTLSRELAHRLGGDIHVTSEVGAGSTFTLVLPLAAPPARTDTPVEVRIERRPATVAATADVAATTADVTTAPAGDGIESAPTPLVAPTQGGSLPHALVADDRDATDTRGRAILVVEDDVRFAEVLRDLAREREFRCLVATTAAEAIALATTHRPVAALLDVQLPDDSGLTVLHHFKRTPELRHVPVHVLSVVDHAAQALGLGAVGFAVKPVTRETLARAFDRLRSRAAPGPRRVLVVEDAEAQRESVRRLLAADSVEIDTAASGAEALEALRARSYDCVVLDLTLPDMSGYDVLDRLAQDDAYAFPPVIVYTGRVLTRDQEMRLRRYASSIVVKGARSPERLLDEVTLFLHQVESRLPSDQQRMLREVRGRDEFLEGRRILLAEDDVRNVFALTSALEQKGLVLEVARNGIEAIAALERGQGAIELVLMDVMMPEMDGLTAMRTIRARREWARLPVIALTAKAMPDDRRRCIEAGANDYVTKPIDIDKLVSLLRVWMPR